MSTTEKGHRHQYLLFRLSASLE